VVAVSAGAAHNLVLMGDGTVTAWGSNTYDQTNVPAGVSNIVAIAAGGWHNLALHLDGTVVAWGAGGPNTNALVVYGQNVVPDGLSNVVQIAAGSVHSLALVGSVLPARQRRLEPPAMSASGVTVAFPSRNGHTYTLEYKNALTDTGWNALPLAAGNGQLLQINDLSPPVPRRFYRVREW
jgi:hypothetical protein